MKTKKLRYGACWNPKKKCKEFGNIAKEPKKHFQA